jgi:hypothetical protein
VDRWVSTTTKRQYHTIVPVRKRNLTLPNLDQHHHINNTVTMKCIFLSLFAVSEVLSFSPTVVTFNPPQEIHEWFSESLHEVESGEIKVLSDDSWISHEFNSAVPSLIVPNDCRPRTTEHPVGNEWMTLALQSRVSCPTAAQARAPGAKFAMAGRSDGFTDTLLHAGHSRSTTQHHGLPAGRADWFGSTLPPTSTARPKMAAAVAPSSHSSDWFLQALLDN